VERCSPVEPRVPANSGEVAALEVGGDAVPASGDGCGVVDAMQMETANSNAWSVLTVASCGDGEGRPDAEVALGVVGVGVWLGTWR
jgi:hypothetical protein